MQFVDCVHCGKRVRSNANRCHHCHRAPRLFEEEDSEATEHQSLETADDFDYEEFLENEFGKPRRPSKKPWWWYVAWVVLAVVILEMLLNAFWWLR